MLTASLGLQQILAWGGFRRYGFEEEAERLSYKWLYMVTKAFVDFNGIVVEKYDVTRPIDPHKVVRTCRSWFFLFDNEIEAPDMFGEQAQLATPKICLASSFPT